MARYGPSKVTSIAGRSEVIGRIRELDRDTRLREMGQKKMRRSTLTYAGEEAVDDPDDYDAGDGAETDHAEDEHRARERGAQNHVLHPQGVR